MNNVNLDNIDELKTQIRNSYGTLKAFADVLGISETNLNRKLKTLSDKFIRELGRYNIKVVAESNKTKVSNSHNPIKQGNSNMNNAGSFKNVQISEYSSSIIDSYKSIIDSQKQLLDNCMKQLEALSRNLERTNDKLSTVQDKISKIELTISQHHEDARDYIAQAKRKR